MIVDVCVGIISVAFVVLVIYLVITLTKLNEMLKTTNDLALDLKEKSQALNVFFRPLSGFGKKTDKKHRKSNKIAEIIQFATDGIALFNAFKKK